jgi:hypothetical protein
MLYSNNDIFFTVLMFQKETVHSYFKDVCGTVNCCPSVSGMTFGTVLLHLWPLATVQMLSRIPRGNSFDCFTNTHEITVLLPNTVGNLLD